MTGKRESPASPTAPKRQVRRRRSGPRLTAKNLRSVPIGDHTDGVVRGLTLRVRERGVRTWALRYRARRGAGRGPQRRLALGYLGGPPTLDLAALGLDDRYTPPVALGLAEARDLAQLLLGLAAAGIDPLERLHAADRERRAAEDLEALREALGLETVGTLLDRFLELRANPPKDSKEKRARPETLRGWRSLRKNALAPLAGRDPATLTARDVDQWHRETGELRGHPVANRALALLSTCCAWASLETDASGQPLLATNPAADVRPFSEVERQRTLTSDEIRAVWLALDGEDYGDVLRLLLWTGARKTEAFAAEWAEIDIGAKLWTVPPARSKTGVVRRIPLSDAALRMLRDRRTVDPDGRFVFPGRFTGGAVRSLLALSRRVQSRSGVSGWTLHDLRRTTRTGLDDLGVPQAVAKAVLGHLESKLERTYNRNEPLREMRAALNKWARRIDGYVTGGKVVPMARPARREVAQ